MNRPVSVILGIAGIAAGAAVALAAYTKAGQKVRSDMTRKISKIRDSMSATIEKKAKNIHDSEILYI